MRPHPATRDVPIVPADAALIVIDIQNYCSRPDGGEWKHLDPATLERKHAYYFERLRTTTLPNIKRVQEACRAARVEVIFTVIEALTQDGRDRGLDYKISGLHVPKGSWDAHVLGEVAPQDDEILIPKTSSSVFISTNIDYVLRALSVRQVILCGGLTDQCVESAVRDACDLNYLVTLVPDACVTHSQERHDWALRAISGYCRQVDAGPLIEEIAAG